jgi:hypothetical protein
MKKVFAIAALALGVVACNNSGSSDASKKVDSTMQKVDSTVKAVTDSTVKKVDSTVKAVTDSVKKGM